MAVIKLDNINKTFGDKKVLSEFSVEIKKGDYVSIMGESGKGKTTLLNIIGMLESPDSGNVYICKIKNPKFISKQTENLRRHHISYLFQNYGLVDSETVIENLNIALYYKKIKKEEKKKQIASVLTKMGLEGYENRKIFTLSGGEQQRIALAKIMLKNPEIILADEPTGSLDRKNRDYVLSVLKDLNQKGKTIVVVTHDQEVAECANTHICL